MPPQPGSRCETQADVCIARLGLPAGLTHQLGDPVLAAALAQVAQIVADLTVTIDPPALEPGLICEGAHASVILAAL